MSQSQHMKMRTMIMVTSMIMLPLAAVLGLKWPQFSAADRPSPPRPSLAKSSSPREPAPIWGAESQKPLEPTAWPVNAHSERLPSLSDSNNSDYPVVQVSNIDVGGTSALSVMTAGSATSDTAIRPLPSPSEEATTSMIPTGLTSGDPFVQIQQRLRALGATHYSLETWGAQGEAYRFQCRMSAGHDPNYLRHFEATDVDPLRVMQTVLNDVEAWKSGRLP